MSPNLRDAARYAECCACNTANGAKGGRPRKATAPEKNRTETEKTGRFTEEPKKANYNTNINDNTNDNTKIPPEPPEGAEVNKRLGATTATPPAATQTPAATATSYRVRVTSKELRIRKGPGTNYPIAQNAIAPGVYTIVAESKGAGSTKGWGKLKSGAGWISLDFAAKI